MRWDERRGDPVLLSDNAIKEGREGDARKNGGMVGARRVLTKIRVGTNGVQGNHIHTITI